MPPPEIHVPEASKSRAVQILNGFPLIFEANRGQTDPQVDFLARGRGYALFLTRGEAVLVLRGARTESTAEAEEDIGPPSAPSVLRMKLLGANSEARASGWEELPGKVNYFIGNDPAKWRTGVPTYASVKYEEVYPGIDLVYYGNQDQLEYDFVVAPGADPAAIRLAFEGAEGMEVSAGGDLIVHAAAGELRFRKPHIYQDTAQVAGSYTLSARNQVAFQVADYDAARALTIDPVLSYSTYLGGSLADIANSIAVDPSGNVYVAGETPSEDFPLQNAIDTVCESCPFRVSKAFVAKLDPSQSGAASLIYSTYLGGNSLDVAWGIDVDGQGSAYVTGSTNSIDFPTQGAFDSACGNDGACGDFDFDDTFVTVLGPTGSLRYSTYLGGNRREWGFDIAADLQGGASVTGFTESRDFPLRNAFDTTCGTENDINCFSAFVVKLDPTKSGAESLLYSTYLDGNSVGYSIAVDATSHIYITGMPLHLSFPLRMGFLKRHPVSLSPSLIPPRPGPPLYSMPPTWAPAPPGTSPRMHRDTLT